MTCVQYVLIPKKTRCNASDGRSSIRFFSSTFLLYSVVKCYYPNGRACMSSKQRGEQISLQKKSLSSVQMGFLFCFFLTSVWKAKKKSLFFFPNTKKMSWNGLYQQQTCSICKIKTSRKVTQLLSVCVQGQWPLFRRIGFHFPLRTCHYYYYYYY